MLTPDGPKVLEYNVRFGDPETQTLIPLLSDETDLARVILACVERRLDSVELKIKPEHSVTVVAAAGGYPRTYAKGYFITLSQPPTSDSLKSLR
jgi:phosphoribosylamine--glycine ligase / phosphoribosylformylglycinamidine cyclo-ligase